MFWIQGEYSYAVNTIDRGEDDYQVKTVTNNCLQYKPNMIK